MVRYIELSLEFKNGGWLVQFGWSVFCMVQFGWLVVCWCSLVGLLSSWCSLVGCLSGWCSLVEYGNFIGLREAIIRICKISSLQFV